MSEDTEISEHLRVALERMFNAQIAECELVTPFALRIAFAQLTDISRPIRPNRDSTFDISPELSKLSDKFPVVVFENAFPHAPANFTATKGPGTDFTLMQDTFHRDEWGPQYGDITTLLYLPDCEARRVPTYYALEKSVRLVVPQVMKPSLPDPVREALLRMADDDYSFAFVNREDIRSRAAIIHGYETFVDDVFSLIPDDEKLSVAWDDGTRKVVMHSNQAGKVLHGRPASNEETTSPMLALGFTAS